MSDPTTCPNKSKMADGSHVEFHKMLMILDGGRNMQHDHAEMPTSPKTELEVN